MSRFEQHALNTALALQYHVDWLNNYTSMPKS